MCRSLRSTPALDYASVALEKRTSKEGSKKFAKAIPENPHTLIPIQDPEIRSDTRIARFHTRNFKVHKRRSQRYQRIPQHSVAQGPGAFTIARWKSLIGWSTPSGQSPDMP